MASTGPLTPPLSILPQLPPNERELWLTTGPVFSAGGGPMRYAPAESSAREAELRYAHRQGQRGLQEVGEQWQRGALCGWKLMLCEAAAHIKLGDVIQAQAVVERLASEEKSALAASLAAPALDDGAELHEAHPLWLLAHVSVENGKGAAMLPRLLSLGLAERARREPRLAAGLIVNALQQGDEKVLVLLCRDQGLRPVILFGRLREHTENLLNAFFGANGHYVRESRHNRDTLAWLRRAHELLGLPLAPFARYDAWLVQPQAASTRRPRVVTAMVNKIEGARAALQHVRRTTGVQARLGGAQARTSQTLPPSFAEATNSLADPFSPGG